VHAHAHAHVHARTRQVGSLPEKLVPVRVGVSGTPLVVQQERVLIAGLKVRCSWSV